MDTLDNTGSRN